MGLLNSAVNRPASSGISTTSSASVPRIQPQRTSEPLTVDLYRGLKEDFRLFDDRSASRFRLLDKKFCRELSPSYFDRFYSALTGKPVMSKDEYREFFKLRTLACPQSFSDSEEVAKKYAGEQGHLMKLTMPFMEAYDYMSTRTLEMGDHLLPCATVFFIPSPVITLKIAEGLWTYAVEHLGK